MQIERGYADLYAWVMYKVLHQEGEYLKIADVVSAMNEIVPGCRISLDKGFQFGNVSIPREMLSALSKRSLDELEKYMGAQPTDQLFAGVSAITTKNYVQNAIFMTECKIANQPQSLREVYAMVVVYLRRCLASPEDLL